MQSWLEQISLQCAHERCRRLVVLPMDASSAWTALTPWITDQHQSDRQIGLIGVTESAVEILRPLEIAPLKANRPNNLLGYEHDHVVFNAYEGLYPDAIAALTGTIKAGGLFVLICPPFKDWPQYSDEFSQKRQPHGYKNNDRSPRFVQRLITSFESDQVMVFPSNSNDPEGALLTEIPPLAGDTPQPISVEREKAAPAPVELTQDQTSVLNTIIAHPGLPHVITADRGRGKSFLLGNITSKLLEKKDNGISIFLTGPNKKATHSVLAGAADVAQQIRFVPPEQVLSILAEQKHSNTQTSEPSTYLLIDEAASLPIPLLMAWTEQCANCIFATTTHGYEGTGKGFQIRFFEHLNEGYPSWQRHELHSPIRYSEQDPLESWTFESFMLDAEPADIPNTHSMDLESSLTAIEVRQSELFNSPKLLNSLFGLLVNAHYQTKPSDLRDMLDAPGLRIFAYVQKEHPHQVHAACLVTDEGPIEQPLWSPICEGIRRPNGHLIPQSLAFYLGLPEAMALKSARIIRIATHADHQRSGYGSSLLHFIKNTLADDGYDLIGSSFAGTNEVLSFWQQNQFTLVKQGSTLDHVTGVTSALVIQGLSLKAQGVEEKAKDFFQWTDASDKTTYEKCPPNVISLLNYFAFNKGSVETAQKILNKLDDFENQNAILNKQAANQYRKKVATYLNNKLKNRH